jgi:uncharacterized membrane protein YfcA
MELYFGYIGALLIGLVLGLTGGGGSILTVPILVYLMHLNPVTATAYSLFIVGTTSAFGTIQNFRKGVVEVKTAFLFALPSLVSVFVTRKFIVPAIPDVLLQTASFTLTKEIFLMVFFAAIMLLASFSMIRKPAENTNPDPTKPSLLPMLLQLAVVGVFIGLVGAGGGFLIIPALVFMAKLPMRKAIGTSLLIITLNSLIGFTGDIGHTPIDWPFLLRFTSIAIAGIFTGIFLSKFVDENGLKKGFGWFVLVMAVFIFAKELFF